MVRIISIGHTYGSVHNIWFGSKLLINSQHVVPRSDTARTRPQEWGNYDTAPPNADEYTQLQQQYDAGVKKELVQYRRVAPLSIEKDLLDSWAANKGESPILSQMAGRYLCSSASSVSSERLFSLAGLTMLKKRRSLTGDSLARIITVRGAISSSLLDAYSKQQPLRC